jgi:hypothetical protein
MAAARGLPIPPPDEIPPELEYKNPPKLTEDGKESSIQHLMVPITSRSQSYGSEASQSSTPAHSLPTPVSPSFQYFDLTVVSKPGENLGFTHHIQARFSDRFDA